MVALFWAGRRDFTFFYGCQAGVIGDARQAAGRDDPDVRQGKPGRRPQPGPCEVDAVAAWRHAQDIYPDFLLIGDSPFAEEGTFRRCEELGWVFLINTQKNGGGEMEHGYGLGGNAWKNYCLLLQVAQLLSNPDNLPAAA